MGLDVLRVLDGDPGETVEVSNIEGEEVGNPIDVHRGYQPGVVNLHSRDPVRDE